MANPYPVPVLSGEKFGKWTVISESTPVPRPKKGVVRMVECRCDCGSITLVRLIHLRGGRSTGCRACRPAPPKGPRPHLHNPDKRTGTRTYRIYRSMISRCYMPSATGFNRYGGRGISVCDRWRDDYDAFVADMGLAPSDLSIDRINNDGNYEPKNCRWATDAEQRANKSRNGKYPAKPHL